MSATHTNPRRRPQKASSPQANTPSSGRKLRSSATFSPSSPISSDVCDLDNSRFMLPRSPTSVENLQGLIEGSNPRFAAIIKRLEDYDNQVAGHKSSTSSILCDPEVLPVPESFLDGMMHTTPMDIDSKPSTVHRSPHDHASDSGLGSSVSGSKYADARSSARESILSSISSAHGAITGSFSALGASDEKHTLGEHAFNLINDTIIKPILAEESLKDFHPLISDVPRRIGEKNITNLRDLEKTLIFLAPEFSATPKSYLEFCETSIRLLHATVDNLSEQDQRLPSDRPYTNNYFLDLIEQIRRYAAIMAATRQKEANGEDLDDMDYTPGEKIALRGGLSHNGRPAELVREKNGKVISLNKNGPDEDFYNGLSSSKRTLSDAEMDDDEVMRSMARRRKSEKPGDVMHVCRDCKKDFKRPCDLTKHEKTHSRPWKCSEQKCKYFDLGWPTEKERDRHVNDKHSAAPPQYKCHFQPCTYASKRESNCKQHMEKAHGWEYVRSKSNGRKRAPTTAGSERSAPTPLTPFMGTPQSAALTTPSTPWLQSPPVPVHNTFDVSYGNHTPALSIIDFQDEYRRESITTDGSAATYSSGHSPTEPTLFENAYTPEETTFDHNIFNNLDCGGLVTNFNTFQQHTPALSTGYDFSSLDFTASTGAAQLSPLAQPGVTLYSPAMHLDEGFGDEMPTFGRPSGDFTLFESTASGSMGMNATAGFFPEINHMGDMNPMGGQYDQTLQFDDLYADPPLSNSNFDDMMGTFGSAQ